MWWWIIPIIIGGLAFVLVIVAVRVANSNND